jgi:hypothetical protein
VREFSDLAILVHANIQEVYRDLNQNGWLTYQAMSARSIPDSVYGWSRLNYLMFFRTLDPKFKPERPMLRQIYPETETDIGLARLMLGMSNAFLRGTRIIEEQFLDLCYEPADAFLILFQSEKKRYNEAIADEVDLRRESLFRMLDTLRLLTSMVQNCWGTYWRTGVEGRRAYEIHRAKAS